MSSRPQTRFASWSATRQLLILFALFYVVLCGSLGIYLCQEPRNLDTLALVSIALLLTFNMFLPFFMIYIWELHDMIDKLSNKTDESHKNT